MNSPEIDKHLIEPIDRILFAKKWNILPHWILKGLISLCERPQPLSVDDMERFGSVKFVAMIAIARERVQSLIRGCNNTGVAAEASRLQQECSKVITEIFQLRV